MLNSLFSIVQDAFSIFKDLLDVIPSAIRNFAKYAGSLEDISSLLVRLLNVFGL